jgi:hypothetical protein
MDYVLAKLTGVDIAKVKATLKAQAPVHAGQGMFIQHFWLNTDATDEVQFLFRVDDLSRARAYIDKIHADARRQNPGANLPQMTYLSET